MIHLNERAWKIVRRALPQVEALGGALAPWGCGALVFDAGVQVPGGYQAGLLLAEASAAGLVSARVTYGRLAGIPWPQVEVSSDQPYLGCFASQMANWPVDLPGVRGMGSGPACLLAFREKFSDIPNELQEDCAVLVLEAPDLPGEEACLALAGACGVAPERLAVLVAPTSSLAGSTQIAARSIETALHKLHHLGFNLACIKSALGRCLIAAPCGDNYLSLGKTNDAMTFGSQVWLSVTGVSDGELEKLVPAIPAGASRDYGKPFLEVLAQYGDFYAIDPGLFAPAEVVLANLDTGRIHQAGCCDEARLAQALYQRR
jgi:methenyltetrahydromethanopterin cyclohydrolase